MHMMVSHVHHVGIKCAPCGYHMHTYMVISYRFTRHIMTQLHANYMVCMWWCAHDGATCTPSGYHKHTMWVSQVHLMWLSHVHHVGITCVLSGYNMCTMWASHIHLYVYHMCTMWVSHALYRYIIHQLNHTNKICHRLYVNVKLELQILKYFPHIQNIFHISSQKK